MADHNIHPQPADSSSAPRSRLPIWAKFALTLVLVGLASVGYLKSSLWQNSEFSKTKSVELDSNEEERKPVQDFEVKNLKGKTVKLSELRGKVVILAFWASWCPPCLLELPVLNELQDEFEDEGLVVLPVNVDEPSIGPNFSKDLWEKKDFDFPIYLDNTKALANRFAVDILPANFVIDRRGRLAFSSVGANNWSGPDAKGLIEDLLLEPASDEN